MTSVRSVTVKLKADIGDFQRGMVEAAGGAQAFGRSLDDSLTKVDTKLTNLQAVALSLGPALVPMAAAATVGIAALGTQLTLAAGGAGVAVLALAGVGDALKAVDTYAGAPTQANLDALHDKLDDLSVAGQRFVLFLHELGPKLEELKASAQAGFLPGLEAGMTSALTQFPVVNQLVGDLASTMGRLAAEGGEAFKSPFWQGFLADFARNASTALQTMGESIGNVATGLAGMFQAFLPAGASFSQELLHLSEDFSAWGRGLSDNRDFKQFIAYVESTAPEVAATLASISKAILAILAAAGPIGPVLLPVIKDLADGLAAVANSPAGPAIVGAAVAITSLAKALALLKAVGIVSGVSTALKGAAARGATEGAAASGVSRFLGGAGLVGGVSAIKGAAAGGFSTEAAVSAGMSAESAAIAAGAASATALATIGAGAAGAAALLAPVAIGFLDAKSAADDLNVSMKGVDSAFGSSVVNLQAQDKSLQDLSSGLSSYQSMIAKAKSEETSSWNPLKVIKDASVIDWNKWFNTDDADAATAKIAADTTKLLLMKDDLNSLNIAMGGDSTWDTGKLQTFADKTISSFTQAGHSVDQFWRLVKTSAGQDAIKGIVDQFDRLHGAEGPAKAVAAAIAQLGNAAVPATQKAQDLQTALANLFGPQLNVVQATDAWTTALRDLDNQVAKHSRDLKGNTAGAIQNRAAIGGMITKLQDSLVAGAGASESTAQFTKRLTGMYYGLIHTAVQLGFTRDKLKDYLATVGLTPKEIKSVVKLYGVEAAEASVASLKSFLDSLHDKDITITTREVHVLTTLGQFGGGPGGIYGADGLFLQWMANGGFPAIGDQPPQIQPNHGPRGITWAETGAGPWEAFISGAPQKRDRSRSIADETVSRLGGVVQWMADGGVAERKREAVIMAAANGSRGLRGSSGMSFAAPSVSPEQIAAAVNVAVDGAKFVLDVGSQQRLTGIIQTGARAVVDSSGQYGARQRRARAI